MKPEPLYCAHCGRDGMCWDCASDYHNLVTAWEKRRRDSRLFWWSWSLAAVLSLVALAWAMWPKK